MTELEDLSPEQQSVVRSWGQGLAVLAGAGSGKTTTLVIKCAELLKRNPEARFAAVSFTERSASDLRMKLSERLSLDGSGGALSGHWVMTIHGLCGAIIREYPREAGFDGEETMLAEPESQLLWERALESLWVDELPTEIETALRRLLARESRTSLAGLLQRVRNLAAFGALETLTQDEDSRALAEVARHVLERYDRLKRRKGALDFNDLERGADRALSHPEVSRAYRGRFDLVLVDEFQDTNPLQARIILRLVREDLSNLCVVGDPKQSIYRFRDADVSVFEEFCAKLPARHSLTWNFRSRPPIIEFANRICAPAFEASQMEFEPLEPRREAADQEAVTRLDVTEPADLARWILSEAARGIPIEDMALLLRKIRGNERWLKALSAAGIPLAVSSGGLYWEDPRVRELVAFLKWWDNPANSLSGATFLRAPWIGIPDPVIDAWLREDPTFARPFFSSRDKLAEALAPFRGELLRPGELLLALLVDEAIEDELGAPLLGLWHRAEELSMRGLDFRSVVAELAACVEEGRRERDVPPPRGSGNAGQLSVLTLHGSKGLEFPHVILLDFGKKGRAPNSPLLYWDRAKGAYLAGKDEDGDRLDGDPLEQEWKATERLKDLAESKRVFYVALTRARERLILVCPALSEKDLIANPETVFTQDFWRGWIECAGGEIARAEISEDRLPAQGNFLFAGPARARRGVEPTDREAGRLMRPRHSVTEWSQLERCPRAYEWKAIRPSGQAESPKFKHERPARARPSEEMESRELGTRIHAYLEKGDLDGLAALETEVGSGRFEASALQAWARESDWMRPADPESGREVFTELAFEIPVVGEVLVGSIDRLIVDPQAGSPLFTVIDFKFTERSKSDEELLTVYQTQMELYAWALRRLEPQALRVEAHLVNISGREVRCVEVPLRGIGVEALAKTAARIVAGESGAPRPGPYCGGCDLRLSCPEAKFVLLKASAGSA